MECSANRWADPIWMAEMNAMRDEFIAPSDWQPCSPSGVGSPQQDFADDWAVGPINCTPPREQRWCDPNYVEAVRPAFPTNCQEAVDIMYQDQGYQVPDLIDLDPCGPCAPPVPSTPQAYYPGIADREWRTQAPIPEELMRWTPDAGTPYGTPPNCYNMDGFMMPLSGEAALRPDPMAMRDLLRMEMLEQPGCARDRAKHQREQFIQYHKAKDTYGRKKAGRRDACAMQPRRQPPPCREEQLVADGVMAVRVQQALENAIEEANLPVHVRKSPAADECSFSTSSSEVMRRLQCQIKNNLEDTLRDLGCFEMLPKSKPCGPKPVEQAIECAIQEVKLEKHISKNYTPPCPPRQRQMCIRTPDNTPSTPTTSTSTDEVIIRLQRKLQANLQQILRKHGLPTKQTRHDMEDMEAVNWLMENEGYGYSPKPHPSHWKYAPRGRLISPRQDPCCPPPPQDPCCPPPPQDPCCPPPPQDPCCPPPPQDPCCPPSPQDPCCPPPPQDPCCPPPPQDPCCPPSDDMEQLPEEVERAIECALQEVNLEKHLSKNVTPPCPPRERQMCIRTPENTPSTPTTSTSSGEVIRRLKCKLQCNLEQILRKHGLPTRPDEMEEDMDSIYYLMENEGCGYSPQPHPSHWRYPPRGRLIPPAYGDDEYADVLRAPPECSPSPECNPPRRRALHELPAHKRPGACSFQPMALGTEVFSGGLRPELRKGPMKSMLGSPPSGKTFTVSPTSRRHSLGPGCSPLATSTPKLPMRMGPPMSASPSPISASPCPESPPARRKSLCALPAHKIPGATQYQSMATGSNIFSGGLRSGLNKGPTTLNPRKTVARPAAPATAPGPCRVRPSAGVTASRGLHELPAHRRPGAHSGATSLANSMASHSQGLRENIYKRTSAPKPLMRKKPPC